MRFGRRSLSHARVFSTLVLPAALLLAVSAEATTVIDFTGTTLFNPVENLTYSQVQFSGGGCWEVDNVGDAFFTLLKGRTIAEICYANTPLTMTFPVAVAGVSFDIAFGNAPTAVGFSAEVIGKSGAATVFDQTFTLAKGACANSPNCAIEAAVIVPPAVDSITVIPTGESKPPGPIIDFILDNVVIPDASGVAVPTLGGIGFVLLAIGISAAAVFVLKR